MIRFLDRTDARGGCRRRRARGGVLGHVRERGAVRGRRRQAVRRGRVEHAAGNGWREEMICSIKAQALASGQVSKVVVANRNTDTAGQIEDLRGLISAGVNAIIVNPPSDTALNDVIKEATDKGIAVVAVDQGVTAPTAYVLSNDQENYGYLGAKWLFDKLGGKGNVIYMRGIEGVPADTDRDKGFKRALTEYPNIKVAKETFTGWDITKGAQQIRTSLGRDAVRRRLDVGHRRQRHRRVQDRQAAVQADRRRG